MKILSFLRRAPLVSVLVPCYNASTTLDNALISILEQSLEDLEVIVVDDGSSDGSRLRLDKLARSDRRLRVFRQEHSGIIAALQHGLKHCRAAYIARMDADDWSYPSRLERQLELLEGNEGLGAVGCRVEGLPDAALTQGLRRYLEWVNGLITPQEIAREIFIESPLPHPSALIRRSWLERIGGYHECGWPEDYDLWLRMHNAGARLGKVNEVLLAWRDGPDRLTRRDPRYAIERFLKAKAYHLLRGPLREKDALIIWGAGQMGRRISKHLVRGGAPLEAFVDIDPAKIGRRRQDRPIVAVQALPEIWARSQRPVLLAAVGSRMAREEIRRHLERLGLAEGRDWWAVA
jgi:glycosyltransferase involved in cell wall biosynthesis